MNTKFFRVLTFFLFCGCVATAQIKKGTRMAGASIGSVFANAGKSDYSDAVIPGTYTSNNNNFGISLNPILGWFISDNTAVGTLLTLGYRHQKVFDESGGSTFRKNTASFFNFGIGGFARNYFSSSGTMKPFGQFNMSVGTGASNNEGFFFSGNDKSTYDGKSSGDFFINAGLSAGFTKMLNPHTGLDFFLGYSFSYNKNTYKTTTLLDQGNNGTVDQTAISEPITKFTNHGFLLGIGFQVFLDRGPSRNH
jgi:hypothetical protein